MNAILLIPGVKVCVRVCPSCLKQAFFLKFSDQGSGPEWWMFVDVCDSHRSGIVERRYKPHQCSTSLPETADMNRRRPNGCSERRGRRRFEANDTVDVTTGGES